MHDRINRAWLAFRRAAYAVGAVQARIVLAVMYFVILLPFAALGRLMQNPFKASGWIKREEGAQPTREDAMKQS